MTFLLEDNFLLVMAFGFLVIVKRHDFHIKSKSYRLEILGSWSFNMVLEP